ncbi:hypothetical protein [Providencia rettgeri]|uniref:hypothetical protein n=1 Tax=Providencia rettgeri TaxID=587 RepID=UPI001BAAEC5F|nr:hypothetical protein [Providencia rettgeri]MBS0918401.1 hypothetical protein [Providencia rettgeri]
MKNPKLITKPFAQNGQKNAIPENFSSSMESNQATWDTGFGQITMIPVAAGGLPPKGQDFNGIFNQLSENVVYLSKGGRFKFSADYAAAINGYPKGAILQSDDEKKEYQSLVDNNKVNFNTATQAQINAAWKLFSADDIFTQIDGKQPKGDYIKLGEYGVGTKSSTQLTKLAKNWGTNGFWVGELENGVTMAMGVSVNHINGAYGFNFYARNSKIYYTCTEDGVKSKEMQLWTENNFNPLDYALLNDMNIELAKKQPVGNYIKLGEYGFGTGSSAFLTSYAKDWNKNGFFNANKNNSSSVVVGVSCNHRDGLYSFNLYGRSDNVYFSTRENGVDSVIDGTFYTSANTAVDRNGYLRSSVSTVEMQAVPIGSSIIWNSTAPIPENFWPNEGRSFSASEYPELAKILPSLKLPDDRGYALRIADNGRGIDAGRTVGTYQEDAMQNIVGEIQANIGGSASGVFSYKSSGSRAEGGSPTGGIWTLDISTKVRTANETRMKNVSKILITRVK